MKFELCAASLEAIQIAKELNFDRIELCQNLEQGGLTPSYGMIEYAEAFGIETHVLIRPRPGGFFYNEDEIEIILREVKSCARIGVKGIVIGALSETGEIDKKVVAEIINKANGMEVTFHRAFDDSIDWERSLETLIELGVTRVLSSGMSLNVDAGFSILQRMVKFADSQIEIMPGGGVSAANIKKICEIIQPAAVHFSGTVKYQLDEESMFSENILKVDAARVKRTLDAANLRKV
ncbi:MAG: copper homeostasis protein CutC [Bacteroidota bacterium]